MDANDRRMESAREPESLADLARLLGLGMLKSLPMRIVVSAIGLVVIWVGHTLLVAGANEGFNATGGFPGSILAQFLALKGRFTGGTLFWFLFGLLVSMTIAGLRTEGSGFFGKLGGLGAKASTAFSAAHLPVALAGAATGVTIFGLLFNRFDAVLITGIALLTISQGSTGFFAVVTRCTYNDGRRIFSKPKRRLPQVTSDSFMIGLAAASIVMATALLLPRFLVWGAAIALIITAVVMFSRGAAAATGVAGVLTFAFAMSVVRHAFADDGGLTEATGPWILSPGALEVILAGLPIGIAGVLGGNIGAIVGGDWGEFDWGEYGGDGFTGGPESNPNIIFSPVGGAPGDCQKTGLPVWSVDTVELRFVVADTLFAHEGVGPAIRLAHSWGASGERSVFGRGWRFSYEHQLTEEAGELRLRLGNGAVSVFDAPSARVEGAIAPQRGGKGWLTAWGAGWIHSEPGSRERLLFESAAGGTYRLAAIADSDDQVVRIGYDAVGRLSTITDAAGRAYALGYDGVGYCTSITLPDGRAARYEYSPSGDMVRATDLAGVESVYAYDEAGLITAITVGRDARWTQLQWTQASWGPRVASITDAAGGVTRYDVVSDSPRDVAVTDPVGRTVRYASDGGRTTRIIAASGATATMEYVDGALARATDALGAITTIERDPDGRWRRETDAVGAQRTYFYDEAGRLTHVQSADGAWAYTYDERGRMIERVSPGGKRWQSVYDERGLVVADTDPAGTVTRYEHDAWGNVIAMTDATGAVRRVEYDAAGLRPIRTLDPLGNATSYEYDANDRITKTTYPDGTFEETIHGCCAPIMTRDSAGVTRGVDRDEMLRPVRVTEDGRASDITYDAAGSVTAVSQAGVQTRFAFDADGRPVLIEGPGGKLQVGYDAAGRVAWTTDPKGNATRFAHDAVGRRTSITDALGRSDRVIYDAEGRLAGRVNARGSELRLVNDADGAPAARYVDGVQDAEYEVDARGQLASITDRTGTTRLRTDEVGRYTSVEFADGSVANASLNAAGAMTRLEYPGGFAVDIQVDARNRPARMEFGGQFIEFGYDGSARLSAEKRSNGVASTYRYTGEDLTGIEHVGRSGALASLNYLMDAETGRTVAESGTRPVTGTKAGYARDIELDAAAGLASLNGAACSSDADGNLAHVDGILDAEYDQENHLIRFVRDGATTEFVYDGVGRRASKTTNGKTTVYYRDLDGRLLAEGDGKGRFQAWYVWAENLLVARVTESGDVQFYHGDRQGSILALTGDDGAVVAAYDYDAYGSIIASAGKLEQPFTWQGRSGVHDDGEGLYSVGPREYFATSGRFMQRDPSYPDSGWDAYEYAAGNPVDLVDYTGYDSARSAWNNRSRPPAPEPSGQYIDTPRGKFPVGQYTPGPGGGLSKTPWGVLNVGVGLGLGGLKLAAILGVTATPVGWAGWALAGAGLLFGIARTYQGAKTAMAGARGEKYGSLDEAIVETVDPSNVRSWPGRASDWVCGVASDAAQGARNFTSEVKHTIWRLNQPSTWIPNFGY